MPSFFPKLIRKNVSKTEFNLFVKVNPNGVLARHRNFLKNLELKKTQERDDARVAILEEEKRVEILRE